VGLMMMLKLNSALPDKSIIDSLFIRLNGGDYSMRRFSQNSPARKGIPPLRAARQP
jgi:hypothetical protein